MRRVRHLFMLSSAALAIVIGGVALWAYQQLDQDTIRLGRTKGELVFMSDRDGDWDFYLLDTHGELHNLTATSEAHEYYPGFTFDGDQLSMFSTASGGVSPALVNVDGSGFKTQTLIEALVSVLADGNIDWDPAWAPGGDRMAWNKVLPGLPPKLDLMLADSDGAHQVQLTDSAASEGMHAWSPDGTRLVYTSDASGYYNTYVLDLPGGKITRLTDYHVNDYQPFWSATGEQILVITSDDAAMIAGHLDMFVMNPDGSDLRPLGEDTAFQGDLTYSPYGGQVAYVSNETGYWHIYVMDADGSHVQQITSGESNNLYPAWRPVPVDEQ